MVYREKCKNQSANQKLALKKLEFLLSTHVISQAIKVSSLYLFYTTYVITFNLSIKIKLNNWSGCFLELYYIDHIRNPYIIYFEVSSANSNKNNSVNAASPNTVFNQTLNQSYHIKKYKNNRQDRNLV